MPRSFDKNLRPAEQKHLTVEVYTYPFKLDSALQGLVWLDLEVSQGGFRSYARLQPAEARTIAQALLDAADQAEADIAASRATAPAQQPEQVPA